MRIVDGNLMFDDDLVIERSDQAPKEFGELAEKLTELPVRPDLTIKDWKLDQKSFQDTAKVAAAQRTIDQLRPDIPLLLLPVRLETRFTSKKPRTLQVRVFPDQIALDGLERRLSETEIEEGREFLKEYDAAEDHEQKQGLWAAFCGLRDPTRAAWIVHCLNSGEARKRNSGDAETPAKAPLLPDCWLVTGRAGGKTFHASGNPIPQDLAFSPDLAPEIQPTGDLALDPAVAWMVDFEEALNNGMALEIPLPSAAQDAIDELFVVGVRTQGFEKDRKPLPPAHGSRLFEKLLEAHNYDWGGGFVPAGTATNNTNSVRTDWAFNKPDLEALRMRELEGTEAALSLPDIDDDGDRALRPIEGLAASTGHDTNFDQAMRAFGLDESTVLRRFEHRQGHERAAARAMNRLLWPVTVGEMLSDLLGGPGDRNVVPPDATEFMEQWFCEELTGGNPLPALRSAATTYGLLPIESFTHRTRKEQSTVEGESREELGERLRNLLPEWQSAVRNVLRLAERPEALDGFKDPTERYLGILRQDSSPAGYEVNGASNLRGWPQLLYALGENIVHPKNDPVDVYEAFESDRSVAFLLTGDMTTAGGNIILEDWAVTTVTYKARDLLSELWRAAGLTHYRVWPETFGNGAHQEKTLRSKIKLLDVTLNPDSAVFPAISNVRGQSRYQNIKFEISREDLYDQLIRPVKDHIVKIRDALQAMLDLVVDHRLDNSQFLQAGNPPDYLYKGIVGDQDVDPRISWLGFHETTPWPDDKLVEVDQGANTVPVSDYLLELAGYAESRRTGAEAPERTRFPKGDTPLLYTLLRTAIRRADIKPDPISKVIDAEFDRQELEQGKPTKLEPDRISELTERIKGVGSRRSQGGRRERPTSLERTLARRNPDELKSLAAQLRQDAKRKADDKKFPAKDAGKLAAELERVAKLPPDSLQAELTGKAKLRRTSQLLRMQNGLETLAKLNAEQVELLMQQTLGLASWRLDAWLTSLTTKRLLELRDDDAKTRLGLQVGAFGWVEDLRRDPRTAKEAHEVRSQGFIHTPSLTHAKAAAVLRSGWNAYGDKREESPLAVDLSSERMRFAEWAFAAISRGQDPGDILGREFERVLRNRFDAPEWIFPIRQAVQTMADEEPDPNLPVVDGLELHRQWKADPARFKKLAREELERVGGSNRLEFASVTRALQILAERIDALADAGLAEAMFALVQGNPDRAGAQLSAISDGITGPSELQMLSTAPAAVTQTHRIVMLASDGYSWSDNSNFNCPLDTADPASAAIAARNVASPSDMRFRYAISQSDGSRRLQGEIAWSDLIEANSSFAGGALLFIKGLPDDGWSQECETAMRLKAFLTRQDPESLAGGDLEIHPTDDTVGRLELALAWREVLFTARALHPRDCGANIEDGTAQLALGRLEERCAAIEEPWLEAAQRLMSFLPEPVDGNPHPEGQTPPDTIYRTIEALLRTGWSVPLPLFLSRQDSVEQAYAAAWSLVPKLREVRAAIRELPEPGDDTDARARRARACLKLLLGANAAFAAEFHPADPSGVNSALRAASERTQDSPIALHGWLEKMAYVREPLRRLNDAALLSDCSEGSTGPLELAVAQWPHGTDKPWIAIAPPMGREGPSISWLMAGPIDTHAPDQPVAGIVIDEVIDKVPANTVNTGVALHFDAPNCEAPQTLLLALPPEGESWNHELLLDTLSDCFSMAKMRPVDSDSMPDFNALLPAIFLDSGIKPGGDDGE